MRIIKNKSLSMRSGFNIRPIEFKVVAINSILLLLIFYFTYHSINGQRGVISMFRMQKEIADKTIVLKNLTNEKKKLGNKVTQLYPKTLDTDYLDELARRDLGYIGNKEKLVILKSKK